MQGLGAVCSCPSSWERLRLQFVGAIVADSSSHTFALGLSTVCEQVAGRISKAADTFLDVSFGSQEEVIALAGAFMKDGDCLAGLAAGAYACLVVSWLAYNYPAINRLANIVSKLFTFADGCFEPGQSNWKITSGQVWRQVRDF